MTERKTTAALVASESGAILGIVTDQDLRARALGENKALSTPVHTVMSAPLLRIAENALIYEALMRMEEHGVRHLAVEDRDGNIVSVIDSNALIQFPRYGPMVLLREIGRSATPAEVAAACARATPLAASLLGSSARPRHVTSMLTAVCDAATERLVQLAMDDLGPPPAAFVFIAMGSQGRQEQSLLTDQDNGIIFAPAEGADPAEAAAYFLRLGGRVCDGLRQAGYAFCRGQVMASNPRWCRSLAEWRMGFDAWARAAEPQEIADFSIFLDFRAVVGEAELAQALRRHVHAAPLDNPAFLHHFAQNALTFKPPFRLLGNIYLGGGTAEHAGEIDLKEAMMPIVTFARLYALRHQISQTHTLERIAALAERNLIADSSRDEIAAAYDFLMQLRLQHHLEAIQAGRPPRNSLHPGKLGHTQQELLKQAFAQIAAVQKKVGYDYPGSG
jgi:CBS domain-containing protein